MVRDRISAGSNGTDSYLSQVKMSKIKKTKPTPNPTSQNRYPKVSHSISVWNSLNQPATGCKVK